MQDTQIGASLDLLERRYCRIYPAALLLRYFTQVWVGGGLFMVVGFYVALTITSEIVQSGGSIVIAFGLTVLIGLLYPIVLISWVVLVWLIFDLFGSRAGMFAAFAALVGTVPLFAVILEPSTAYFGLLVWPVFVVILLVADYLVGSLRKGAGVILLLVALISLLSNIALVDSILQALKDIGTLPLPADISIVGFTLLMVALGCYPTLILSRAAFGIIGAGSLQRLVLPDGRGGITFWSNLLGRLLGLPSTFEIIRRARLRFAGIVVLSFIRTASMVVGVTIIFVLPQIWAYFLQVATCSSSRGGTTESLCPMPLSFLAGLASFGPIVTASLFLTIGWAAQRGQQHLARLSLRSLQRVDHRAPVLFLRAFRDDQVQLAPARFGLLGRWLSLARRKTSLDEMLLEEGTIYGPVVALGNPMDRQPPYGAARAYLDNKVWQEVVTDLYQSSH